MPPNTNTGRPTSATQSESIKAKQPIMLESLRPSLCIQRDDNTVVPLIAMDELPNSVVLKGVPTTLTVLDALKFRMELIPGKRPTHGARYQLAQPINTQTSTSEQGDESGSDASRTSEGSGSTAQKGAPASDKKGGKGVKDKALRQPHLTTNDTSIIDPIAKTGTIGKKVYCTYWIQTGNCNYMQEGCKYKHEIPKDEETRRAIGFREFPNWPREELPIQTKAAPALHKPWRRQDGKSEFPRPSGHSSRMANSPATVHGTPKPMARGNNQTSTGVAPHGPTANTQYNPNPAAFAAPPQHFPTYANHMAQQRSLSQGGQSFVGIGAAENYQQRQAQNLSPPSYYQPTSHVLNGGHPGNSSPPKQPPISRPTNLGQSSATEQQKNAGASTRGMAPDHHIVNKASGFSGAGMSASNSYQAQTNARQGYNGMQPNTWNPQSNAPTSMGVNFISPSSDSTHSGSQAIYTPSSVPTVTPTPNIGSAFSSLNGNGTSDIRTGTPAHYNAKAFANNGNLTVKGRGPIQFGRDSPAPSNNGARNAPQAATVAVESDAISVTSNQPRHRILFREEGEPEFVMNSPEPKPSSIVKGAHGLKKHGKKAHAAPAAKSAKGKMMGNGYDLLDDHQQS